MIEAIGMAEAERMKLKAEALQSYGEAAQLALVLDALPEVRREQPSPALGRRWGVPMLGQDSWRHREAPCGSDRQLIPRSFPASPDRCQSGCSALQSG